MASAILPGTQVAARGLRWEVVHSQAAGEQQLYRLRCVGGSLRSTELGKTIQAGLVLAELTARRRAHRVLIVSPAGPLLEHAPAASYA